MSIVRAFMLCIFFTPNIALANEKGGGDESRRYLERTCVLDHRDYKHFIQIVFDRKDISWLEKYLLVQKERFKIDELKDKYADLKAISYYCVGEFLDLEGQALGYYVAGMLREYGYRSGDDFVYSEYRQDNFKRVNTYWLRSMEIDREASDEHKMASFYFNRMGMAMYAPPELAEALMRHELDKVADVKIVGEGTEHPMSREEFEANNFYYAASAYAQRGRFDEAKRLIEEMASRSAYGLKAAESMGKELQAAVATYADRNAAEQTRIDELKERTRKFQPIIWAIANSKDGQIPPQMLARLKNGQGEEDNNTSKGQPPTTNKEGSIHHQPDPKTKGHVFLWLIIPVGLLLLGVFWWWRRR